MEKEGVSISKVARVIPRRNSAFSRVVPRTAPGRDAPRHLARARGARPRPRHRPTSASVPSFNSPGFKTVETVGESWENGAREDEAKAMRYHGTRCYKDETKLDAASLARSLARSLPHARPSWALTSFQSALKPERAACGPSFSCS